MAGSLRSWSVADISALWSFRTASLTHHIGVEPDVPGGVDLAIDSLYLGVKTREGITTALEHLQIIDHGPRPRVEPLTGDDCRDAGRVDDEQRCGDASVDLADR